MAQLDDDSSRTNDERRGRGRHYRRCRLLALPALTILAGAALAGVLPGGDGALVPAPGAEDVPSVLELPPKGDTAADELHDGSPVFVVHHEDGSVDVLSAVATHLDHLVIWCAPERTFVEPVGATKYTAEGDWIGGPDPYGLAVYDSDVVERDGAPFVQVAGIAERADRSSDFGQIPPAVSGCFDRTLIDAADDLDEEGKGVLLPTPFSREPLTPAQLQDVAVGTLVVVEGTLDLDTDPARLCATSRDACDGDGVSVTSSWWHDDGPFADFRGVTDGRFLVRAGNGKVTDLAQLRRESLDPHELYIQDLERTHRSQTSQVRRALRRSAGPDPRAGAKGS